MPLVANTVNIKQAHVVIRVIKVRGSNFLFKYFPL